MWRGAVWWNTFGTGEAWEECWRNVWIFWSGSGKIMKDSSQGAENHTEKRPPTVSEGPRGGRCCQSDWGSARKKNLRKVEVSWLWTIRRHQIQKETRGLVPCVMIPRLPSRSPVGKYYPALLFSSQMDREVTTAELNNYTEICTNVKETVSGAGFGHERSSEPRSFFVGASPVSLWVFTAGGRWGEQFIYPLRHMTNRGGGLFIWEQHAGKWRE